MLGAALAFPAVVVADSVTPVVASEAVVDEAVVDAAALVFGAPVVVLLALSAFPTSPTPYALVDAPSSAQTRPDMTCCMNVSFCQAACGLGSRLSYGRRDVLELRCPREV